MTHHRQIILRELPATKTTDQAERARAAPCRYSAEWEIDEGSDDETDPLWGMIGFGATEAAAHADLAAQTARAWREQTDEELRGALGELADDAATMEAAIARAEQLAKGAINTATGSPFADAQDSERLLRFAQEWTATVAALRRLLAAKPEPSDHAAAEPAEPATELPPEVAQVSRALEALFSEMPPEARQAFTFSISLRASDGRPVIAIVATRDPDLLAELSRMGLLAAPDEVTFTSPDGRTFTGSPADVGVEVADALIEHEGETWSLPSVIREHAAEHLARVLDVLRWDPADRTKAAQAALHLYCLINAESDEVRAQRHAALDEALTADKITRQPGESDEELRQRVKAASTADPTQESPEADEGPEPYRLRGDDEEGWMIDDDPLLRVWDTAADAMAEVLGDWWEEEPGCWMATAIESARPGDADKPLMPTEVK